MTAEAATLTEVELAAELRFSSWRAFARARRAERIPAPDLLLPDGPRWSRATIERWLSGRMDRDPIAEESSRLIEELGGPLAQDPAPRASEPSPRRRPPVAAQRQPKGAGVLYDPPRR